MHKIIFCTYVSLYICTDVHYVRFLRPHEQKVHMYICTYVHSVRLKPMMYKMYTITYALMYIWYIHLSGVYNTSKCTYVRVYIYVQYVHLYVCTDVRIGT